MVTLRLNGWECKQSSAVAVDYSVRRIVQVDDELIHRLQGAFSQMDINETFDIKEMKIRLSKGHYFFVMEDQCKIIGWVWVGVGPVYYDEFNCVLKINEKSGYFYNVYIDPAYRGKKLNQLLQTALADKMKKEGFNILWGLIYYRNTRSIKSFEEFGHVDEGPFRCLKILYKTFLFPPIRNY
jgi:L-amino acid N-acyltransferase YncA